MLIGFYSIIFADRRLARPGVSKVMRRMYCKKHTLYVIAMIIIQLCQQLVNFYQLFNPNLEVNAADQSIESYNLSKETINRVTYYAIFSTGIVFAVIRTSDPFYLVEMKRWIYGCFGIIIQEPKEEYKKEILQTFLASSLSSELVYITLAGITRFICCLSHTEVRNMIDKIQKGVEAQLLKKINSVQNTTDDDLNNENAKMMSFESAHNLSQINNLKCVQDHQHIRSLKLNKIKILGSKSLDISQFEQRSTRRYSQDLQEDVIINEEVRVSDFAFEIFQKIRTLDGITKK